MNTWVLYLIRIGNGDLYTGITLDVERRLEEHRGAGKKGAKYLRGKGPLDLVFSEAVGTRSEALKAERRVKKLPKRCKESLVSGGLSLKALLYPSSRNAVD